MVNVTGSGHVRGVNPMRLMLTSQGRNQGAYTRFTTGGGRVSNNDGSTHAVAALVRFWAEYISFNGYTTGDCASNTGSYTVSG
jgi:hypothetical protein